MLEIKKAVYPSSDQWDIVVRGMRNPYKSWDRSDSEMIPIGFDERAVCYGWFAFGEKDIKLAKNLIKSGAEHAKFLRQLPVIFEIKAPMYWWKQMDQYKVGTTTDSESTMHTLMKEPFTIDDFVEEYWGDWVKEEYPDNNPKVLLEKTIESLNFCRDRYLEAKEKDMIEDIFAWEDAIIHQLPMSYYQTRTWSANYAVLFNICAQRAGHPLIEWDEFISFIVNEVPYFKELCFDKLCQISSSFNSQFNRQRLKKGQDGE